jgi:hypothetical protein
VNLDADARFGMVPAPVLDALADDPRALTLYAALVTYWADRDGRCKVSLATVAARLRWPMRTVQRAMAVLVDRGIVTRRRYHRPIGGPHAGELGVTHYRVLVIPRRNQAPHMASGRDQGKRSQGDQAPHMAGGPGATYGASLPGATGGASGTTSDLNSASSSFVASDDDEASESEPDAATRGDTDESDYEAPFDENGHRSAPPWVKSITGSARDGAADRWSPPARPSRDNECEDP